MQSYHKWVSLEYLRFPKIKSKLIWANWANINDAVGSNITVHWLNPNYKQLNKISMTDSTQIYHGKCIIWHYYRMELNYKEKVDSCSIDLHFQTAHGQFNWFN